MILKIGIINYNYLLYSRNSNLERELFEFQEARDSEISALKVMISKLTADIQKKNRSNDQLYRDLKKKYNEQEEE